jgi:hypothetical protein
MRGAPTTMHDFDDRPPADEREPLAESARKLHAVAAGLRLVNAGFVLTMAASLALLLGLFALLARGGGPPPAANVQAWASGLALLLFFAGLLQLAGRWGCRDLPDGLPARAALRTAIAVDVWSLLLQGWARLAEAGNLAGPPQFLADKVALTGLVAPVFFLLFLVAAARYVERDDLARRAQAVLALGALAACAAGLLLALAPEPPGPNAPPPDLLLTLAVLALSLALLAALPLTALLYGLLLRDLPRAAEAYARRLELAAAGAAA